jgi:hypothetical protein
LERVDTHRQQASRIAARRRRPWGALSAVTLLATLLLAESLVLPGRVLLPLLPDDFPAWQAGRDPAELARHEHPNWCMSDVLHLIVPGLRVNAEAAARGELPLWDGSQALGVPHLHEVHHGVLYPPAWLPVWLGYDGLAWAAWLHLVVAATGMLAYLHAIGRDRGGRRDRRCWSAASEVLGLGRRPLYLWPVCPIAIPSAGSIGAVGFARSWLP